MVKYEVFLIDDAEKDICEIHSSIARHDSPGKADKLLNSLEKTCYSLSTFPNRGHIAPELEHIGIFEYKEIHFKPYGIIYQIIETRIYVYCILDGRRAMQQLLQERLLRR